MSWGGLNYIHFLACVFVMSPNFAEFSFFVLLPITVDAYTLTETLHSERTLIGGLLCEAELQMQPELMFPGLCFKLHATG